MFIFIMEKVNTSYKRKRGLDWETALYIKLVNFLVKYNVVINKETVQRMSINDVKDASKYVFPKYGNFKVYKENLLFFIQSYFEIISNDCTKFKKNEEIIAPKLKAWLKYKNDITCAMLHDTLKDVVDKFIQFSTYEIPYKERKMILNMIYNITDKQHEPWMMSKLINSFKFNRKEICDHIKILRNESKNSCQNNNDIKKRLVNVNYDIVQNNNIYNEGCNTKINLIDDLNNDIKIVQEKEEGTIKVFQNIVNSNFSHVNENARKKVEKISADNYLENNNKNQKILETVENVNPNSSNEHKKVKQVKKKFSIDRSHIIKNNMIQFHSQNDKSENEKVTLIKKLIILKVVLGNNNTSNFDRYMTDTKQVDKKTKTNILKKIYNDKIEERSYFLLDLLVPYRYIIKQNVLEIHELFTKNGINLNNSQMDSFENIENLFYEAYHKVMKLSTTNKKINSGKPVEQNQSFISSKRSDNFEARSTKKFENLDVTNNSKRDNTSLSWRTVALTTADDLATLVVLDFYYLEIVTHKINKEISQFVIKRSQFKKNVGEQIVKFVSKESSINETTTNLVDLIKIHLPDVKIPSSDKLVKQIKSYLKVIDKNSGFKIELCFRYKKDNNLGAKICATKFWAKGSVFEFLCGYYVNLKYEESEYLENNGLMFSILQGSNKKDKLWLGPGAFVNHHCNPNSQLYYKTENIVCLQAIRDIQEAEEITFFY